MHIRTPASPETKGFSRGEHSEDRAREMELLRSECERLAQRIKHLEEQKRAPADELKSRSRSNSPTAMKTEQSVTPEEAVSSATALAFTLREINGTLGQLDGVFRVQDAQMRMALRSTAVTTISSWFRGLVIQRQYEALRTSMRRQRRRRIRAVRRELVDRVQRRERIENSIALMSASREQNILRDHLVAWSVFTCNMRPVRSGWHESIQDMHYRRGIRLQRKMLVALFKLALGPNSRKNVALRYRERRERAREEIVRRRVRSGKPPTGMVVTNDMIREQMHKEATRLIHKNHKHTWKRTIMNRWIKVAVAPWRAKRRVAEELYQKLKRQQYFYMWRKFVRSRSEISGTGGRKKYNGRKRWKMRHNLFLIIQHHNNRKLRSHFKAWHVKCHRLAVVRRAFSGHMNTICRNVLRAWRIWATLAVRRKLACVEEWKAYGMSLYKVPFRAWFIWTQDQKKSQAATRTLLSAWERRKLRELKYQVFKVWRHQAAYGKVEGMFSRVQLLRTVDEQKKLVQTLTTSMDVMEESLKTTQTALQEQVQLNEDYAAQLKSLNDKKADANFAQHNAEQEIVRLQSILDSIALIHPGTVKQLEALSDAKKFENRKLADHARSRAAFAATMKDQQDHSAMGADIGHESVPQVPPVALGSTLGGISLKDAEDVAGDTDPDAGDNGRDPDSWRPSNVPEDAVWLRSDDAAIVLRARHVSTLFEPTPADESSESNANNDKIPVPEMDAETARLQGLLAFIVYGNTAHLRRTSQTKIKDPRQSKITLNPEQQRQLEEQGKMLRKFSRTSSWGQFVEDMSTRFPLRHRVNLNTEDRLVQRIGRARQRRNRNETEKRPGFNILSAQTAGSLGGHGHGAAVVPTLSAVKK